MSAQPNGKLFLSLFVALSMCAFTIKPVMAAEVDIDASISQQNAVELADTNTIEPAVFSVTVPTSLPIHVDSYGRTTSATNASIINNSNSAVRVVDIEVEETDIYQLVGYDENFAIKRIDSNQMAINFNGLKTQPDGGFVFSQDAFAAIPAGETQTFFYYAKVTGSTSAIDTLHAANVYLVIDWDNPVTLTYDAYGGMFANGNNSNIIKYTSDGYWIEGSVENPTRDNCTFDGWWTDTTYTTQFTGQSPTSNTTVWAKWLTEVTIQHCWQDLDNSYSYTLHETETITATVGQTIWPAPKTYDQYKTPSTQSLLVDASGNCTLVYAEVEEDMVEETTAPDESEDESPEEETDTAEQENTTPPSKDPEFSEEETKPPSEETAPSEPNKETAPTEGDSQKEQTPANPPNPSELPESSEPPANTEPPSEPPTNESDDPNIPGNNLHQEEFGNETDQDSEKPAEQPSVPTEPEGEESTDIGEGASEESQIEDSDDSELPKEEEKSLVEPVYYCGLDAHIHGEDCTNSTICEMEEHEHDSSCLTPKPSPEESKPEKETEPPTESEPSNEPVEETPPPDGSESSDNTEDIPITEKEPELPPEPPDPPTEEQPPIEEPTTPPTIEQEAESSEETS